MRLYMLLDIAIENESEGNELVKRIDSSFGDGEYAASMLTDEVAAMKRTKSLLVQELLAGTLPVEEALEIRSHYLRD